MEDSPRASAASTIKQAGSITIAQTPAAISDRARRPPAVQASGTSASRAPREGARTERTPAPQQQAATDLARSRIRSAPEASKAMETLCASTEFQATDAFDTSSWAIAFRELSGSEKNSSDSSIKKEGAAGATKEFLKREEAQNARGAASGAARGVPFDTEKGDSRARESATTTQRDRSAREKPRLREGNEQLHAASKAAVSYAPRDRPLTGTKVAIALPTEDGGLYGSARDAERARDRGHMQRGDVTGRELKAGESGDKRAGCHEHAAWL